MVNLAEYYKYQIAVENLSFPTISYEAASIKEANGVKAKKLDYIGNVSGSINRSYGLITAVKNFFGTYTDEQANSIKVKSRVMAIVKNTKTNQIEKWQLNTTINNLARYPDFRFYKAVSDSIYIVDEYEVNDLEFKRNTFGALKEVTKGNSTLKNFSVGHTTLVEYMNMHDTLLKFQHLVQNKEFVNLIIDIIHMLYDDYKGEHVTSILPNE